MYQDNQIFEDKFFGKLSFGIEPQKIQIINIETTEQNFVDEFKIQQIHFKINKNIDSICQIAIQFIQNTQQPNFVLNDLIQDYIFTYNNKQRLIFSVLEQKLISQNFQLQINDNQLQQLDFQLFNQSQYIGENTNHVIQIQILQENTNYILYQSQKMRLPQVIQKNFELKIQDDTNLQKHKFQTTQFFIQVTQNCNKLQFNFPKTLTQVQLQKIQTKQNNTISYLIVQDKSLQQIQQNNTNLQIQLKKNTNKIEQIEDYLFEFILYTGDSEKNIINVLQYDQKENLIGQQEIDYKIQDQISKVNSIVTNNDIQNFTVQFKTPISIQGNYILKNKFYQQNFSFDNNCELIIKNGLQQYNPTLSINSNIVSFDLQQININQDENLILIYKGCIQAANTQQEDVLNFDIIKDDNLLLSFSEKIFSELKKWDFLQFNLYPAQINSISILELFLQINQQLQGEILLKFKDSQFFSLQNSKNNINKSCQLIIDSVIQNNNLCLQENDLIKINLQQTVEANKTIKLYLNNIQTPKQNFILEVIYQEEQLQIIKQTILIELQDENILNYTQLSPQQSQLMYIVDETYNSQQFHVTFQLYLDIDITQETQIIIELEKEMNYIKDNIECIINQIEHFCVGFQNSFQILINIENDLQNYLYQANKNLVKIGPLFYPSYSIKSNENIKLVIVQQNKIVRQYIQPPFQQSLPFQKFQKHNMIVNNKQKNYPFSTYQIELQSYIDIEPQDIIEIIFPIQYNFNGQHNSIQISTNFDIQEQSIYTYSLNKVYITVQKQIKITDLLMIEIKNILNPIEDKQMIDFQIIHKNRNGYIATQQNKIFSLQLIDNFEPKLVILETLYFDTLNSQLQTDILFEISLESFLPKESQIIITLPEQFRVLPTIPLCSLSGAINQFSQCEIYVNQIIINTEQDYVEGNFEIQIKDLLNPQEGLLQDLQIQTKFNNILVHYLQQNIPIQIAQTPEKLIVNSFDILKNNDGEYGDFIFILQNMDLIQNNQIVLRFQRDFFSEQLNLQKVILEPDNIQYTYENLSNKININFVSQDYFEYIKIIIKKLILPEKVKSQNSSIIQIGLKNSQNQYFFSYNKDSAVIYPQSSPKFIKILDIYQSNNYAGDFNNIFIEFKIFDIVPLYRGQIVLKLPPEYYFSKITHAKVQLYEIQQSEFGTQYIQINQLLYTIKENEVWIQNNYHELLGSYKIQISDIVNPEIEDQIFSLQIYTYDNYSQKIIASSYLNIEYYKLQYTYKGRPIVINNNESIFIEKGTQSQDIFVVTEQPFLLDLKLKANLISGISITPFFLDLQKGTQQQKFRIQVDENINIDNFQIEWQKMKDLNPQIYQPIKRTNIIITSNKNNIIEFEENNDIPLNGTTLSNSISLKNSPDISIEIKLVPRKDYSQIQIDKNFFQFTTGIEQLFFRIDYIKSSQSTEDLQFEFDVILQGENKDVYNLSREVLIFNIIEQDIIKPEIINFEIVNLTQSNVVIQVTVSEISDLYFMIALIGTEMPSLQVLKNQGPSIYSETQSQFGKKRFRNNLTLELQINNLYASTEYVFYAILIDRGNNLTEKIFQTTFYTLQKYRNVLIQIPIIQPRLNSSQRFLQRQQISFQLAIPLDIIQEDLLSDQIQENYTQNYILISQKINNQYIHPQNIAKMINLQNIKFVSNENFIQNQLEIVQTQFSIQPIITSIKQHTITVQVSLKNKGFVYAVAIPLEEKQNLAPRPFQIYKGLDSNNKKQKSSYITIRRENQNYNLHIYDLLEECIYLIYLVPATGVLQNPDLMNQSDVIELEQKITYKDLSQMNKYDIKLKVIIVLIFILCF